MNHEVHEEHEKKYQISNIKLFCVEITWEDFNKGRRSSCFRLVIIPSAASFETPRE